jgi:hypothetical protein
MLAVIGVVDVLEESLWAKAMLESIAAPKRNANIFFMVRFVW